MLLGGIRNSRPLRRFRRFRYTRPFWGGLLVLAGGLVVGVLPIGPAEDIIHAGKGVYAGLACSGLLLLMGLVILFLPSQRVIAGIIAVVVSLASFVLSNLGGFVVGMLLGMLGGALAFGWVPDKSRYQRAEPRRGLMRRRTPMPAPDPAVAGRVKYEASTRRRPAPMATRRTQITERTASP